MESSVVNGTAEEKTPVETKEGQLKECIAEVSTPELPATVAFVPSVENAWSVQTTKSEGFEVVTVQPQEVSLTCSAAEVVVAAAAVEGTSGSVEVGAAENKITTDGGVVNAAIEVEAGKKVESNDVTANISTSEAVVAPAPAAAAVNPPAAVPTPAAPIPAGAAPIQAAAVPTPEAVVPTSTAAAPTAAATSSAAQVASATSAAAPGAAAATAATAAAATATTASISQPPAKAPAADTPIVEKQTPTQQPAAATSNASTQPEAAKTKETNVTKQPEEDFFNSIFYFSGMGKLIGSALAEGVYVDKRTSSNAIDPEEFLQTGREKKSEPEVMITTARGQIQNLASDFRELQTLLYSLPTFTDTNAEVYQRHLANANRSAVDEPIHGDIYFRSESRSNQLQQQQHRHQPDANHTTIVQSYSTSSYQPQLVNGFSYTSTSSAPARRPVQHDTFSYNMLY